MQKDSGKVSLAAYDGRRPVNTPTSVEACRMEGITPEMLVLPDIQRKYTTDGEPFLLQRLKPSNAIEADIKRQFAERKRDALLQTVLTTYKQLLRSPPRTPREGQQRTAEKQGSPKKPKPPQGPKPPGSFHNVTVPEDNFEVAQYYLQIQKEVLEKNKKIQEIEKKLQMREERARAATARRAAKVAEEGRLRDEKLNTARLHHEESLIEAEKRLHQLVEEHEKKTQSIKMERQTALATLKANSEGKEVSSSLIAVKKTEDERLEKLLEKINKAHAKSKEMQDNVLKELEKRNFMAKIQQVANEEKNERVKRATEYRQKKLAEKAKAYDARQRQHKEDFEMKLKERTLQREVINRQKQEVANYLYSSENRGPPAAPPAWLLPQIDALKTKMKNAALTSPRAPIIGASADGSPRSQHSLDVSARTFQAKERFTIGNSAPLPERQVFGKWMYQD